MFSRISFFFALCAAFFWNAASADWAVAQVLTPPERVDSSKLVKVHFVGVVCAKKKYSFSVQTPDRIYVVKPSSQAEVTLRLNKPMFDFSNWNVRVLKVVGEKNVEIKSAPTKRAERKIYDLPESLFVVAQFDHVRQMKRLMQADVKRINHYTLTKTDPGPSMPTEETLRISGRLLPGKESTIAQLSINENKLPVTLGQRGAVLKGFSIQELKPLSTEVVVWGELGDDEVVSASKIEFRPIATIPDEKPSADKKKPDGS